MSWCGCPSEEVPARRHLERLADLRLAVERRVAELPALMVRRAKAEGARTSREPGDPHAREPQEEGGALRDGLPAGHRARCAARVRGQRCLLRAGLRRPAPVAGRYRSRRASGWSARPLLRAPHPPRHAPAGAARHGGRGARSRALRHRFRQVVADGREGHDVAHALGAHVREVLGRSAAAVRPRRLPWPALLTQGERFSRALVEEALRAYAGELGRWPSPRRPCASCCAATPWASPSPGARTAGCMIRPRRSGGAWTRSAWPGSLLEVLKPQERNLLRHLLLEEGTVEDWARGSGPGARHRLSRACSAEDRLPLGAGGALEQHPAQGPRGAVRRAQAVKLLGALCHLRFRGMPARPEGCEGPDSEGGGRRADGLTGGA